MRGLLWQTENRGGRERREVQSLPLHFLNLSDQQQQQAYKHEAGNADPALARNETSQESRQNPGLTGDEFLFESAQREPAVLQIV